MLDASPVHRALRLRVVRADDAGVRLAAEAGPEHTGEDGSQFLHGGVVATLLDTAATFALIQATGVDWGTAKPPRRLRAPGASGRAARRAERSVHRQAARQRRWNVRA